MTDPVKVLSDDEVSEIESRANAATEGPWTEYHRISPRGAHKQWHVGNKDGLCQITMHGHQRDYEFMAHAREDVPALCATVRALRQQIAELTAEWCECGHAKTQHGFFSDHDECYECDQMSDDLCCEWRPANRKQ